MATASAVTKPETRGDPVAAIADFTRGFSLEATHPSADDIAQLAQIAPAGTRVYVSAVSTRPAEEVIVAAVRLRKAGFEPVPHLAVRNFATARDLDEFLARVSGEAEARCALVIAGDRDHPAGQFRSSIEVIDGGALRRHGITEIGIAGYPDGHPRISQQDLDRALADKVRAADTTGMAVHIVTQFGFDGASMLKWIARLRNFGIEHPVRIGLAGPTNLATLLRYAQRCGVRASAQGLARQAGLLRQLFAMSAPDALLRVLAEARAALASEASGQRGPSISARADLGDVAPHFFSFGGLARTARWAQAVAERRITLDGEGFRVEPPKQ